MEIEQLLEALLPIISEILPVLIFIGVVSFIVRAVRKGAAEYKKSLDEQSQMTAPEVDQVWDVQAAHRTAEDFHASAQAARDRDSTMFNAALEEQSGGFDYNQIGDTAEEPSRSGRAGAGTDLLADFDIRKAVLYSEILKPKYLEETEPV